ncbi:MAG TPA: SDR family oxidoreductase [Kofleriaceae bacterium]|nr:SDR family oxidoreductase [Kofleriaceae bacterium]
MNLTGQHVVVTGGSKGLGRAMVEALVARGARVTAIARDAAALDSATNAGAVTVAGDATDADLMNRIVADTAPDVLILNAGARLTLASIDEHTWESFSAQWNTDVKAGLVGIQAALRTPMKPGGRVVIMSSGAAMVLGVPYIPPDSLRLSGGYIGAKRMVWFMAHSAGAVSRERGLGIRFQVLVPLQLMPGTELGHQVASAYARIEGVTAEEHVVARYGSILEPAEVGAQVANLLGDPRHATGVAYGVRAGADLVPLDQPPDIR